MRLFSSISRWSTSAFTEFFIKIAERPELLSDVLVQTLEFRFAENFGAFGHVGDSNLRRFPIYCVGKMSPF